MRLAHISSSCPKIVVLSLLVKCPGLESLVYLADQCSSPWVGCSSLAKRSAFGDERIEFCGGVKVGARACVWMTCWCSGECNTIFILEGSYFRSSITTYKESHFGIILQFFHGQKLGWPAHKMEILWVDRIVLPSIRHKSVDVVQIIRSRGNNRTKLSSVNPTKLP